jgi:hypothetical protein
VLNFYYLILTLLLFLATGCTGTSQFDNSLAIQQGQVLSGYVIASSAATGPATAPGYVSMFDNNGKFVSVLDDLYPSSEIATGLAYLGNNQVLSAITGSDRIDLYNLVTGAISTFATNVNITGTLRHIARSPSDGSIYIMEDTVQDIEKLDASGNRVGGPFVATTVTTGSVTCTLANPYGVTVIPSSGNIAVISAPGAAGRLHIYDDQGNCLVNNTGAPFNAGTPTAIVYHPLSGKLIVAFSTSHAIYAMNVDGSGPVQIYLQSTIINDPRALAVDSNGNIFVASQGTSTIEKLYWSGTGTATRAGTGSFAGPNLYTHAVTALTVVP